ncbi:hypothetical protein TI39_contig494g00002 [Zymoseptoria brevis]|uniref:Uncharacterized protein n=1 Tax=Zymoseptoria brevis TaxID=1047168 RepID=A0A0F4GK32_9PEZI|nr:hypothetical protein TI39_contig494g00002 [Zymoseptoria brevis]
MPSPMSLLISYAFIDLLHLDNPHVQASPNHMQPHQNSKFKRDINVPTDKEQAEAHARNTTHQSTDQQRDPYDDATQPTSEPQHKEGRQASKAINSTDHVYTGYIHVNSQFIKPSTSTGRPVPIKDTSQVSFVVVNHTTGTEQARLTNYTS